LLDAGRASGRDDETVNVAWVLEQVASYLWSPFASWQAFLDASSGLLWAATYLQSKTAWLYLLSSLVIAWFVWAVARRRGWVDRDVSFRQYVMPRDVYLHRSAIADYKYVAVDLTIRSFVYAPLITVLGRVFHHLLSPIVTPLIVNDLPFTSLLGRSIVFTVLGAAFVDFLYFFAHFLMHRIPYLWHFHEVHHSAEVLTPVTVYRIHPVEEAVNVVVASIAGAFIVIPYQAYSGSEAGILTVYGVNVVMFGFFVLAFQLRHSHIWLGYGPMLSRIFISPAQHQIHHSVDPKHWNKNYGFTFAVWDLLFRSLYVPKTRETLTFGVPGSDPRDFATIGKIYWLPFVKAFHHVLRRRPPTLAGAAQRVSS
jgi:sterol desaturase/sphingolipid hydroxylase (fatty acid hydroxylase superfamily)